MTIDDFVSALREAMPEMHKRGWVPVTCGAMLRVKVRGRCRCPIEALADLRGVAPTTDRLGIKAPDMSWIVSAADFRTTPHKVLRSRLIGAYQDYCRTLK